MYPAKDTLIEFCQENALVIANTLFQQYKRRLYTWTSPEGQHQNKDVPYIIEGWNAKVVNQDTPGVTSKFGLGVQNEAGQRLIEFCQENALVIANTLLQQHKRLLYTWTSPDGQY